MSLETIKNMLIEHKYIVLAVIVVLFAAIYYFKFMRETFANQEKSTPNLKKLVLFYSKTCGHCTKLMDGENSAWSNILKNHKNSHDLVIEEVDCEADKEAISKNNIEGFPTIKLLSNNQEHVYKGDNSYETIEQFIQNSA